MANMKYIPCLALGALSGLVCSLPATAADGLSVEHLGTSNTLVRVSDDARYVLFPVEESVDDAALTLLLDGRQESTFYVRLARNKVDYYVPFDISRYKGRNIIFNIVTAQGRSSVREASDDACWKTICLSDTFDIADDVGKYRPAYHHTPLYGWMNDPNGMFYRDGVWHLYYQYNPYGSKWQNMTWGHSSSTDLINWDHHSPAIEPNGFGSVFSGSCVVDSAGSAGFGPGAVVALYTSAGLNQMQSLAHSADGGDTFTVYLGNPILTLESEARDPNMFWNAETGEWNMLLAHALDREMLIFSSHDLKTWTLQSAFGKGLGAQDGVWECPDLMRLPVEGTGEHKWVLICNLNPGGPFGGSATQYFVGDFDGKTFTADTDAEGRVPTKWMDYGKDHYATVSWSGAPDGRHVVIGWMSNWQYAAEVPTRRYRSANTLPRDISLFRSDDGGCYLKTVPSPELLALRDRRVTSVRRKTVGASPARYALPADGLCEIEMSLNARKASAVTLTLSNSAGEEVVMTYDPAAASFSVDRTRSGLTDFSHDFPAVVTAPTLASSAPQTVRIFVDRSSVEVFDGDGRFVLTNLVFPTSPYRTLSIAAAGGKATVSDLGIHSIKTDK